MREGGVVGEGWGGEAKARVGDMYVPGILRALLLLFLSRRRHCNVLVVAVVLPGGVVVVGGLSCLYKRRGG